MLDWFKDHAWWVFLFSAITFVGSLVLLPVLVARMRADYFVAPPPPDSWAGHHPVLRWVLRGAKNLLGALLVLAGIAMLVLPGQGILTILIGITLLDFPGKRRLERAIVSRRPVLKAVNWIRRKANRDPLRLDFPATPDEPPGL